jgi:hypothetical protein
LRQEAVAEAPHRDWVVEVPQEPRVEQAEAQEAQEAPQTLVAVVAPVAQEPRVEQAEAPAEGRTKDAAVQAAVAEGRTSVAARH